MRTEIGGLGASRTQQRARGVRDMYRSRLQCAPDAGRRGPGRPLLQDAAASFVRKSPAKVDAKLADRGPLLLISGSDDHTVPLKVTKEVFGKYAKGRSDTEL